MTDRDEGHPFLDPSQRGLDDMSPDEFRAAGRRVVDTIASYLGDVESYPVLPDVHPGDILGKLPGAAPLDPEPMESILRDYRELIEPNLTHWQHPAFMGYFGITGSGAGILGDALASAANVNHMLWRTGPSPTELEMRVLEWLRQMIGLPETFTGLITDTASISSLLAVATARHDLLPVDVRNKGLWGTPEEGRPVLYLSTQTHSSLDKAVILLGLGLDSIRRIPVDAGYRMDPDALAAAIAEDRTAGRTPLCVVATLGTTSTTSLDPVDAIAEICEREKIWLHVDAAYAGSAAICPELRDGFRGWERADSVVLNPHKWMFVPMHMSLLYCRHFDRIQDAFSLIPEYLRTTDSSRAENPTEEVFDYMNYGVQLGRKFRAVKLWIVLRYFGVKGLQRRILDHVRIAREFADTVDSDPWMERLAPVPMSTVCFRVTPPDVDASTTEGAEYLNDLNERVMAAVNKTGEVFLSHTVLDGRFTIRLVVSNMRTKERHVERAKEMLLQQAKELHRGKDKGRD